MEPSKLRGREDTALKDALGKILNSGAYSDMKIRLSDETEIACHRAIVCERCDFFKNALQSGFKETHSGVEEMFYDPPEAVTAMISYLYTADYPDNGLNGPELVLFHLDVYIIAETYLVEGLAKIAKYRLVQRLEMVPEVLPNIWEALRECDSKFLRYPESTGLDSQLAKWAIQKFRDMYKATWDVIAKESPSFIQYVTAMAWTLWDEQCAVDAAMWLERFEGPDSTGRTVFQASRCPGKCGYVPGGVSISSKGLARARCDGCGNYFASSEWYSETYDIYEEQAMRLYDEEEDSESQ
ncbi:hypothetical protein DIS24_g11448 [Lasiodiplodia hormozganensis]|uniref:BTB domain-containing protein n=1 Tax=Lasiodiplodia hormozganensis TaxID=869390 RepID=A0AA39WT36_9PEZI|nr:hypothetical protein DIS24_g11448 [Lasiodiplodia hormozganensis]